MHRHGSCFSTDQSHGFVVRSVRWFMTFRCEQIQSLHTLPFDFAIDQVFRRTWVRHRSLPPRQWRTRLFHVRREGGENFVHCSHDRRNGKVCIINGGHAETLLGSKHMKVTDSVTLKLVTARAVVFRAPFLNAIALCPCSAQGFVTLMTRKAVHVLVVD